MSRLKTWTLTGVAEPLPHITHRGGGGLVRNADGLHRLLHVEMIAAQDLEHPHEV